MVKHHAPYDDAPSSFVINCLKNFANPISKNALDPKRRNVVEFRHASWWNESVYKAFRKSGIIFCSCSGPKLPDELITTSDEIYIRFHGIKQWYRHDYSTDELANWAQRIADCGAKRVWVYFNNDREGNAIRNAQELLKQMKEKDNNNNG